MTSRHPGRTSLSVIISLILAAASTITGCNRGSSSAPRAPAVEAQTSTPAPPAAAPAAQAPAPAASAPNSAIAPGPAPGGSTAEELEQLVSPIALYPDTLVAQILAASTYPTQVVEAHRWLDQNASLKGEQFAAAVNQQGWDPSVKSLCQYPSVLKTMSDSLSWTSSLGQAYYNQPTDVLNAIQVMRKRAIDAGTLKSTPQQIVQVQSAPASTAIPGNEAAVPPPAQTIIVNPAQPNTVYVPQYNPSAVYGTPVAQPAGYTGGELLATGLVSFGAGMLIGSLINNNDNNWGCNWSGGNVTYNRNVYVSNTNAVPGRWNTGYRPAGYRPGYPAPGYPGGRPPYPAGGYPRPQPYAGNRPAFNGNPNVRPYNPGNARVYASGGEPHFPSASQLSGGSNALSRLNQMNRPNPNGGNAFNNPHGGMGRSANPGSSPNFASNMRNDKFRGYGGERGGGNNNAFGGSRPARETEAFSDRGQQSFRGNGGFLGGRGGRGGAGEHGFGGGGGRRRR